MIYSDSPHCCSKCGSRNVALRDIRPGIPLFEKLVALFGVPARQWGAKRIVCQDCGHTSIIHIM